MRRHLVAHPQPAGGNQLLPPNLPVDVATDPSMAAQYPVGPLLPCGCPFNVCPEVYELHPWRGMGDSRFNLDIDTCVVNLLTQKLVELHDGASSDKVPPSRGPSPTGLTALWCIASSLARSCSVTPSHRMSLVRSHSNSTSSASSHDSASDSPAASNHEGPYSRSISLEGDVSNNNGMANSGGEVPIVDEHPDSDNLTVALPDSDDMGSRKAGSDEDGSASHGSHSSSESEVEVVTVQKTTRTKKMLKSTSTIRDAKTHVPGPTQPVSDADKVSEAELRNQWCQDV